MSEPRPDRCETCRFWMVPPGEEEIGVGECRRRAPLPVSAEGDASTFTAWWPQTAADDWCGEWQPLPLVQK